MKYTQNNITIKITINITLSSLETRKHCIELIYALIQITRNTFERE